VGGRADRRGRRVAVVSERRKQDHEIVQDMFRREPPLERAVLIRWILMGELVVPEPVGERDFGGADGALLVVHSGHADGRPLRTWEALGFHWTQITSLREGQIIDRIVPPSDRPPGAPW
jgi:hypothetical protein